MNEPAAAPEKTTPDEPGYPCAECERAFDSPQALAGHMRAHRDPTPGEAPRSRSKRSSPASSLEDDLYEQIAGLGIFVVGPFCDECAAGIVEEDAPAMAALIDRLARKNARFKKMVKGSADFMLWFQLLTVASRPVRRIASHHPEAALLVRERLRRRRPDDDEPDEPPGYPFGAQHEPRDPWGGHDAPPGAVPVDPPH